MKDARLRGSESNTHGNHTCSGRQPGQLPRVQMRVQAPKNLILGCPNL